MFTTFQEPAPSIVSDWSISSRYTVAHRTNRHGALECIYRGVVLHSRRRVGFESDRKPSIEYSFSTAPSEPAIGFPSTRFYVNTRDTLTPAVCRITSIQMLIIFFFLRIRTRNRLNKQWEFIEQSRINTSMFNRNTGNGISLGIVFRWRRRTHRRVTVDRLLIKSMAPLDFPRPPR